MKRSTRLLAVCAVGVGFPAVHAAQSLPPMYLAEIGFFCAGEKGLRELREVVLGLRQPNDPPKGCLPGFPGVPDVNRLPVIVMDADEYPYVWVCMRHDYSRSNLGKSTGFFCGSTLAQWVVGGDGRPFSSVLLKAIAQDRKSVV